MNKLDVIPTQVSARQGHASKRGSEQGSEAADTGLVKRFIVSKCRISSPWSAASSDSLQLLGGKYVWIYIWVVSNRGHKSLPCRSSSTETNGKGSF